MKSSKQHQTATPPANIFTTRAAKQAAMNAERDQKEKGIAEALKKANEAASKAREQEKARRSAVLEMKRSEAQRAEELRKVDSLLKEDWFAPLMAQAANNDSKSFRSFAGSIIEERARTLNTIVECMSSNLRVLKSSDGERVVLEPKDVLKTREMLPGQRTRLFHGTYAYNLPWILHHGFNPSYSGLLGPGLYLGETPKAREYARESRGLYADYYNTSETLERSTSLPFALKEHMRKILEVNTRGTCTFFGAMIEVEAVLGETITVLTRAENYGREWITLHGKAGVTPSGLLFDRTLSKDEWCVRGARHDLPKRLRIVRVIIGRVQNVF